MTGVLIVPYEKNNPYQDNLVASLEQYGVIAHRSSPRPEQILSTLLSVPDINIIHIHWTYPFFDSNSVIMTVAKSVAYLVLFSILRVFGYRFIWTAHNMTAHDNDKENIEIRIKQLFCGYICDTVIAHNYAAAEELRDQLRINGKTDVEVIRHGHYIDTYPNETSRSASRTEFGYKSDDTVYLFIGQIKEYKQVPHLIQSFKDISSENDDKQLLVVGNPENNKLEDEIITESDGRNDIRTVLEFVPSEELHLYLNAADVVVLPYSKIFTSGSAILAMSFSNPVIVPDLDTLRETLDLEGALFHDSDEDLTKALEEIEKRNLSEMGKHNFELATQLSWEDIAEKTHHVYIDTK